VRTLAVVLLFVAGATALALAWVPTALAAPGPVTGLTSATYSTGPFSFSWNPVVGTVGYSYVFDRNAATVADSTVDLAVPPSFSATGLGLNSLSRQIVTADFGNGQIDLAALCESGTFQILLGKGDGTFTVAHTYTTGTTPHSIAVGDFNGDGRPDIAVANWGDDDVGVYLATGTGTFATPVTYPTGHQPHGMVAADLGNGHVDLIVPEAGSNAVSVLLGNGDGTFQPKVDYAYAGASHPEKAVAVDLNGDGKRDVAVINNTGNTVSIFLGNGDGSLTLDGTYATGTTPYWLAAGDLGNGHVDLAIANGSSNTVSVLLGNGDGTFKPKVDYAVGKLPIGVGMVDVNRDGLPDLVVSDQSANNLAVLLGKGDGTVRSATYIPVGTSPRFFASGDFDGDGWPDLAVPYYATTGGMGLLRNTMGSAPAPVAETATADGTWYFHVAAVDVNGNAGPTATRAVLRDTTPPATTDDAPSGWQDHAVTVALKATDSGSGMAGGQAGTWHSLDGGSFTAGTSVPVSGSGAHTLAYYSKDALGNTEQTHTVAVDIDTAPPVTTDNAPSGWQNHAVTVTLHATDSGFGMTGGQAGTWYSLDGGTATESTSVTVSGDGKHTLAYYSKDAGGNLEQTRHAVVDIDTHGPRTWALKAVTAKVGKTAKFVFRVNDVTRQVRVTIVVMRKGHVKAKIAAGTLASHKMLTFRWKDKLPKGTYQWKVNAADQAGNAQSAVTVNSFTVR
jgi:hypothetical protein